MSSEILQIIGRRIIIGKFDIDLTEPGRMQVYVQGQGSVCIRENGGLLVELLDEEGDVTDQMEPEREPPPQDFAENWY